MHRKGIQISRVGLLNEMSGVFLRHRRIGFAILVNSSRPRRHQCFSYAHEYAHTLPGPDRSMRFPAPAARPSSPRPRNDRMCPAGRPWPSRAARPRPPYSHPPWSQLPQRALPPTHAGPIPLPPPRTGRKCHCRSGPCPWRTRTKPAPPAEPSRSKTNTKISSTTPVRHRLTHIDCVSLTGMTYFVRISTVLPNPIAVQRNCG